jgi:hypothetical protein
MLPRNNTIDTIQHHSKPPNRARRVLIGVLAVATIAATATGMPPAQAAVPFPIENLDGSANNANNPTWGQLGRPYPRVGPAVYADGISAPVGGPNARYVSNRIFRDNNQNVFSERRVTQWGWTWGQFLDHTFGLREETGSTATNFNIPFNSSDPLETFTNNLGVIPLTRTNATAGSGTSTSNPRQQNNTTSSLINAFSVYGGTNARLDWLRSGSNDGNPANNNAALLLQNGFLPRRDARGNPNTAPTMGIDGRLLSNPNRAMVAGDVRANENIALTATHTMFAREHNRIVSLLPSSLSEEDKFQIARRIIIAEQQYITYNEWLPALGVALPKYAGYNANVNPAVTNEFAATGYRVHSQIHGEFEFEAETPGDYSAAELQRLRDLGAEVVVDGEDVEIAVSLNNAFFNPDMLVALKLDGIFASLLESQYKNEHQMDNQLRSVLFQVPVPGNPLCDLEPELEPCFQGVVDLGAIDIVRARDHGIPRYNALRQAYGLPAKTSFTAITGESTDQFPAGSGVDNPNCLDIQTLQNIDGGAEAVGSEAATAETMRCTTAARLRAIYGGNVNNVDAFTGVLAEPHVAGTEFGELQLAIWTKQFQALRDGDRFFYGNDQGLSFIRNTYGIDFHTTLGQVIARNTGLADEANINVFLVDEEDLPAPACTVNFTQTTSWPGNFQVNTKITNNLPTPLNGWTLQYEFANGQTFTDRWGGNYTQSGPNGRDVRVTNTANNANIGANGGSMDGIGFNATFDNFTNAKPVNFRVNNRRCATG